MVKNTKQISLMQQRHGKLNELPKQLSTAQFGFADDTNGLFIGNPEHPTLKERYESNTFPYGNVELLTEFSDNLKLIKHSPWMNDEKLYYPMVVSGSDVANPIRVGSTMFINEHEIEFKSPGVVVLDYDYLVLRYIWTDGSDLDTDTRITNADAIPTIDDLSIGWSRGTVVPRNTSITNSVMYWAGDNTGTATPTNPQEENILISRNNLLAPEYIDNLPEIININLSGTWYSQVGHNPVKLEIVAYKGGVMNRTGTRFTNVGGEVVKFIDDQGHEVDSISVEVTNLSQITHTYNNLASVRINKNSGSTVIKIFENEQETSGSGSAPSSQEIDLTEAIKQINEHFDETGVEARERYGVIQLVTINESLSLDDGSHDEGYSALEALKLSEGIYISESITRRTLQEVLDDRYSVKSFDTQGNGKINDGEYINKAMRILYNIIGTDDKELYFPADTYIVKNSLMLMTNAHLIGEGIDRTIIKASELSEPLLVLADWYLFKSNEQNYCNGLEYPHNILIENMTFDVSNANCTEILYLNHCYDIEFKNCKFVVSNINDFIKSVENSILKNLKFIDCVFEGNDTNKGKIVINGELDGLLITNCQFKDIKNTVITLNGNANLIQNGIIGNNRFENCSSISKILIQANEYTRYISVVKALVDDIVLKSMDDNGNMIYSVFKSYSKNNYCDTPIYNTDTNKYLRFNFYQSVYDYVQALYNKYGRTALEVISGETDESITNYLELTLGTLNNENTISLNSTNQVGSVELGVGQFGDLHLGKTIERIDDWKSNTQYVPMELIKYNNKTYICIQAHISLDDFDESKWKEIDTTNMDQWGADKNYNVGDLVTYDGKLYICIQAHISTLVFESIYWREIGESASYIVLHKQLDLNNNQILNRNGDVVFKLNNNKITINDISDKPYEKRIGNDPNAIASVKFVNDAVNSGARLRYSPQEINKQINVEYGNETISGKIPAEITLVDFDSETYGNQVSLQTININVRQLFIPISKQIRGEQPSVCKYLDWTNEIEIKNPKEYKINDVISILNPTTMETEYYKCLVDHTANVSENTKYENFLYDLNAGFWSIEISPSSYKKYSLYEYYPNRYETGAVVSTYDFDAGDDEESFAFYRCLSSHETIMTEENDYDNFRLEKEAGYWEPYSGQTDGSFEYEEYSSRAFSYVTWYKGDVIKFTDEERYEENGEEKIKYTIRFFVCLEDHVASYKGFNNSFNIDVAKKRWKKILLDYSNLVNPDTGQLKTNYAVNVTDYRPPIRIDENRFAYLTDYIGGSLWVTLPRLVEVVEAEPDLRYIAIKSVDKTGDETKWLFDINDVDILLRDTNGFNYPSWSSNTLYKTGDIVSFNYSNFECIAEDDSGDEPQPTTHIAYDNQIDLHNSDVWKKLNEPGFNYEFHYERNLYERDSTGRFYEEEYQAEHNFSDRTLKLCFYDESENDLEVLSNDIEDYVSVKPWAANTFFYETNYVSYNGHTYLVLDNYMTESEFKLVNRLGETVLVQVASLVWQPTTPFFETQYITYNNRLYQVMEDFNSSSDINIDIGSGYLELIPSKYIQLGETGELLISVKIMKE